MRWLLKLVFWSYRLWAGTKRRMRRRFTRSGLAALAGLAVSAITGMEMEQTVVYQIFTLLVGMLGVAFVACLFFRGRFTAQRVLPRFGTAGQPLAYTVLVKNETARPQRDLTLVEELEKLLPDFEAFAAVQQAEERRVKSFSISRRRSRMQFAPAAVREFPVATVAPGGEVEVPVELLPLKRGHLRFEAVTIARPDPLGLVKSLVRVKARQSVLILPRRYPVPALALPGTLQYQQGGVALASSVGESEEFVSLRDYRPGDPLRRIHWRSWARAGRPIVKEFADEFFVRHALVLDTFTDHPQHAAFEEAVSVAASFACTVLTQESLLDLLFVGPQAYAFTAGRGLAHLEQILEVLASVQVCRNRDFTALEALVLEHAARVSGCVCVLLAWDEPRRAFVGRLRQMGLPLRVIVVVEKGAAAALVSAEAGLQVVEVGAVEEGLAKL
jgi:uncharacterized protein (DUF58 family)